MIQLYIHIYTHILYINIHTHTYIYTHTCILFQILFHYRLLQHSKYNFPISRPCCTPVLYTVVCICRSHTPNLSVPPLSLLVIINWLSMSVSLFLFCEEIHNLTHKFVICRTLYDSPSDRCLILVLKTKFEICYFYCC